MNAMDYAQCAPSLSLAQRIRKLAKSRDYSLDKVEEILSEEKKQRYEFIVAVTWVAAFLLQQIGGNRNEDSNKICMYGKRSGIKTAR